MKKFYHGTSTEANISDTITPPSRHNFGINEPERVKHSDKVFYTTVKGYAEAYARRCCKLKGGKPVIYQVFPKKNNCVKMSETSGCDVYYSQGKIKAKLIEVIK